MPSPLLRGIMQENLLQRQKEYSDTNPLADAPQPLLHRSSEPGRSVTATSDLSDQSDQSSGSTAASGLRLTAAASQNNNHARRGRRRSLDPQDLTDESAAAVERHNARATVGLEQPLVPLDSEIPTSAFLQVPRSCSDVPLLTVLLQAAAHIRSAMKGRKPRYIFTEEGIRLRWLFQRSSPAHPPCLGRELVVRSRPIRALRVANAVTYLSICLFELPSW